MTTADWIRLAISCTAAIVAIYSAVSAWRSNRRTQAHLRQARAKTRSAWGHLAAAELHTLKCQRRIDETRRIREQQAGRRR